MVRADVWRRPPAELSDSLASSTQRANRRRQGVRAWAGDRFDHSDCHRPGDCVGNAGIVRLPEAGRLVRHEGNRRQGSGPDECIGGDKEMARQSGELAIVFVAKG